VTVEPFAALPLHAQALAVQEMSGSVSIVATVPCPVPEVLAVRRYVEGWNVAVTVFADVIDTVQVRLSAEIVVHPVQPETSDPGAGAALSVTTVAGVVTGTFAVHVPDEGVVQLRPPPSVTVPEPVPLVRAVSVYVGPPDRLKFAVTVFAASIVTVQLEAVPVHPPDQPRNVDPWSAYAVSTTLAPSTKSAAQKAPQSSAEVFDPTRPDPRPVFAIVSMCVAGAAPNCATTLVDSPMIIRHVSDVPVHAPVHSMKVAPLAGVAVSVTVVPGEYTPVHVRPRQESPSAATLPFDVPATVTMSAPSSTSGRKVAVPDDGR
jgi:hypothetical protein